MIPRQALTDIIRPALNELPEIMRSEPAQVLLLAIGLQESRFIYRKQINGPARGLWQFEHNGVIGVFNHLNSRDHALKLCGTDNTRTVHRRLERDDILACQLARLLLWTDPTPLPAIGQAQAAWHYYLRGWRPGKPHFHTWVALYNHAVQAMQAH